MKGRLRSSVTFWDARTRAAFCPGLCEFWLRSTKFTCPQLYSKLSLFHRDTRTVARHWWRSTLISPKENGISSFEESSRLRWDSFWIWPHRISSWPLEELEEKNLRWSLPSNVIALWLRWISFGTFGASLMYWAMASAPESARLVRLCYGIGLTDQILEKIDDLD